MRVDVVGDAPGAVGRPHERGLIPLKPQRARPAGRPAWRRGRPSQRQRAAVLGTGSRRASGAVAAGNLELRHLQQRMRRVWPTVPQAEVALLRGTGMRSEQPQQRTPLICNTRDGIPIQRQIVLALALKGGIRNEAQPGVGGKARRPEHHQVAPRKLAGGNPVSGRQVRAGSERHAVVIPASTGAVREPARTSLLHHDQPAPGRTRLKATLAPRRARRRERRSLGRIAPGTRVMMGSGSGKLRVDGGLRSHRADDHSGRVRGDPGRDRRRRVEMDARWPDPLRRWL